MDPIETRQNFGISFGCLCDPIATQLTAAGYKFDRTRVMEFEEIRNSIHKLIFSNIINDRIADKCWSKLYTQVKAHVCKKNHLNPLKKNAI